MAVQIYSYLTLGPLHFESTKVGSVTRVSEMCFYLANICEEVILYNYSRSMAWSTKEV